MWRRLLPPDQIAALGRHYGVGDGPWTVRAEEAFARQVESYFRTGKAPVPGLRTPFARLRAWMGDTYGRLSGTPVEGELHPDVRRTFDRLFAAPSGDGPLRPAAGTVRGPAKPLPRVRPPRVMPVRREEHR